MPVNPFKYAGKVATNVLPSPVFISAILPWCKTIPPSNCTLKCFIPSTLLEASLQTANASGNKLSKDSPFCILSLNSTVLACNSSSVSFCIPSSKASILSAIDWSFLTSLSLYVPKTFSKNPIMYFLSTLILIKMNIKLSNGFKLFI